MIDILRDFRISVILCRQQGSWNSFIFISTFLQKWTTDYMCYLWHLYLSKYFKLYSTFLIIFNEKVPCYYMKFHYYLIIIKKVPSVKYCSIFSMFSSKIYEKNNIRVLIVWKFDRFCSNITAHENSKCQLTRQNDNFYQSFHDNIRFRGRANRLEIWVIIISYLLSSKSSCICLPFF